MIRMLTLVLLAITAVSASGACETVEHRQFDFWLGDWTARSADGKELGTNQLKKLMAGCAIQENWVSASGKTRGTSFNYFNTSTQSWHQTWVDNGGGSLMLRGQFNGTSMQLSGKRTVQSGKEIIDRITWTPMENGTVRQYWQTSEDDGETWQEAFDGYYHRGIDGD